MNHISPWESRKVDIDQEYEALSPEGKAQVDRAMRNYERRKMRDLIQPKWDRGRGMYLTDEERYGE